MSTERGNLALSDEIDKMIVNKTFDTPGQLLIWAADNYAKVAGVMPVDFFSRLIVRKVAALEGSEEIMMKFVEYAETMYLKPPKYHHGLHFMSCWYLSRFVEGDLKHRVNSR